MRRRGFPAEAIRDFCERISVAKFNSTVDVQLLESCIRDRLNKSALRVMAVLKPLRVVIENYPEGQVEHLDAVNNPEDASAGTRKVPFGRVLYVEHDDFREVPPPKYFRLSPGVEVRLRYAYFIKCVGVVKDPKTGEVIELRCTYDPDTRGGDAPDGRKVKATLHWVAAEHAVASEARLYEHLLLDEPESEARKEASPKPIEAGTAPDWKTQLNPNSMQVVSAWVEPSVQKAASGTQYQFERVGYFTVDPDSTAAKPVFNRTVTLKDAWARIEKKS
jgi:glutaminyl-tRNA synthetase